MSDLLASRVLVVDDEREVLETAADLLEDEVAELHCVSTFEAAVELLRGGRFDLAVVDLMGVRGLEILERYAKKVPCIALTAHGVSPEMLRQTIQRGAAAYVPKNEIHDLPRYLRILAAAPPGLNLWQVWLHPRLDPMRLRIHLGPQFERIDRDFFEGVLDIARSHEEIAQVQEHRGGIVEVRHREPPLNLLSAGTVLFYRRFLAQLREDANCRAVVFTSALDPGVPPQVVEQVTRKGPLRYLPRRQSKTLARLAIGVAKPGLRRSIFYGAGIPLEVTREPGLLASILEFGKEVFLDVYQFPKPYVTAVEGGAVAGSCEKALCAHYIVADPNAAFWLPEFRLGFVPPAAIPLLVNRVGAQRAFTITAEARVIRARTAARLGLVDRLVKVGRARATAIEVARKLVERQAVSGLRLARRCSGFAMAEALDESFARWRQQIDTPVARAKIQDFFRRRDKQLATEGGAGSREEGSGLDGA